jgi:hypothetical protein
MNKHKRDDRVKLNSRAHTYNDNHTSVTKLVSSFFKTFNAEDVILKMRNSQKWPVSRYYGMTNRAIKSAWAKGGKDSRDAGTRLHEQIEQYYNNVEFEADENDKALDQFLKWDEDTNLTVWRTEWVVWDEDTKVAGTVDAVFKNTAGDYILVDWKRCKEIRLNNPYDSCTVPSLSHLSDCNYVKYSIQLNVYRYILEQKYGISISQMLIVNFHPNQESYDEVPALDLCESVGKIMKKRKSKNNNNLLLSKSK